MKLPETSEQRRELSSLKVPERNCEIAQVLKICCLQAVVFGTLAILVMDNLVHAGGGVGLMDDAKELAEAESAWGFFDISNYQSFEREGLKEIDPHVDDDAVDEGCQVYGLFGFQIDLKKSHSDNLKTMMDTGFKLIANFRASVVDHAVAGRMNDRLHLAIAADFLKNTQTDKDLTKKIDGLKDYFDYVPFKEHILAALRKLRATKFNNNQHLSDCINKFQKHNGPHTLQSTLNTLDMSVINTIHSLPGLVKNGHFSTDVESEFYAKLRNFGICCLLLLKHNQNEASQINTKLFEVKKAIVGILH